MGSSSGHKIIRTTCGFCAIGCGLLVYLKDGKVVKVEGDPDHPLNKGKLCPKGEASLEVLYHPDRLTSPLKRKGERGEGKWEEISWDDALDLLADRLVKVKEAFGAPSVAFIHGAAKGLQESYLARFANHFG
ncbi:MAG: molybdopterin-dependent oxidoreductase, partial [Deltaproteobacteria bacterium]|nr:molybdopterin-dependent oxidoreductase [Deltaproteobacteria bacterium]